MNKHQLEPPIDFLKNVDCALFDLDGTLIDTVDLIYRSFDFAVKSVLGKELTKAKLLENMGRPLLVQMKNFSAQKADQLMNAYNRHNLADHDKFVRAYPNTENVLNWLKGRGLKMGVVTSKKRDLCLRGLEITNLLRFMDVVVAMEDTVEHKPAPAPVLLAIDELHCRAEKTVFIGDSPFDIVSGREAGVLTGAALWGPFTREELRGADPDFEMQALDDLQGFFGRKPTP